MSFPSHLETVLIYGIFYLIGYIFSYPAIKPLINDETFSVVNAFLIIVEAFLDTDKAKIDGNPDPNENLSSNSY